MKRLLQLLILTTLLIGCGKSRNESADSNELLNNQPTTDKIDKDLRKLIKEANLRFRTKDNQETYSLIKNSLKGFGAYISEENTFNYRASLKSVVSESSARRTERRNRSVHVVHEDFEHRPT